MKIGIFSFDFYPIIGGVGQHIKDLNQVYLENPKQCEIEIFSPCENTVKNHTKLFKSDIFLKIFKHIYMSIWLFFYIEKIIKKHGLDIVHLHGGHAGLFLFKKLSVPVVFTCHHTYYQQAKYMPSQKWKYILAYMERLSYSMSKHIICVSGDTAKILTNNYGIQSGKISVIPNGIPNKLLNLNGHTKKKGQLVFAGRLNDPRKGIKNLILTLIQLDKLGVDFNIEFIGSGSFEKIIHDLIIQNKITNKININGFVEEAKKFEIISQSEIMFVPSVYEGFGIVALEGIACGTYVFGNETDGLRYILNQFTDYGQLIDFTDSSRAAILIKSYLIQSHKIKQADLESYTWENIFKETLVVYDLCLNRESDVNGIAE